MAKRFKVGDGKAAIWTDEANELPFTNPTGYISRVKFHSDLDYDAAVSVTSTTLSLPARTSVLSGVFNINLFAHGQAGTPYIRAALTVGGQTIDLVGTVPVAVSARGFGRFVSIGATSTHVVVSDYVTASNAQFNAVGAAVYTSIESYSAQSLPITVAVMDTLL